MPDDYTKVKVERRIPGDERQSVKDYFFKAVSIEGMTFQQRDEHFYTVSKEVLDWKKGPFIITTRGKRMDIKDCMNDLEMNLSETVNNKGNRI